PLAFAPTARRLPPAPTIASTPMVVLAMPTLLRTRGFSGSVYPGSLIEWRLGTGGPHEARDPSAGRGGPAREDPRGGRLHGGRQRRRRGRRRPPARRRPPRLPPPDAPAAS